MPIVTADELRDAILIVLPLVPATPAYSWPLLARRIGAEIVVKHENHTPTGSFKARGGLVFVDTLRRQGQLPLGLVTATQGNHGQSIAIAAKRAGIPAPHRRSQGGFDREERRDGSVRRRIDHSRQ